MNARPLSLAGAVAALALASPALQGQAREPSETIVSDRPGLGDGAYVLAPGSWQIEAGVARDAGGGGELFSFGQAVVRVGLSSLELRLYPGSFLVRRGDDPAEKGLTDLGVGLKAALSAEEAEVRSAVVAGVTLPSGSDAFTADEPTGFATLVLERTLSASAGVAVNVGYGFPFDDAADGTVALIVTPGFAVSGVEGLGAYVGYAGFFNAGAPRHLLEGGLAYLAGPDTQLDVNAGWDPDAGTWFLGVGFAKRWP